MYGGEGISATSIDVYDPLTEKWFLKFTDGDIPPASSSNACAIIKDKFYIFGGHVNSGGGQKYTNALCELDTSIMRWKILNLDNRLKAPLPKRNAAMVAYKNFLITFGGYGVIPAGTHRAKNSYDKNKKPEVWTNELIYWDLNKSKL